MPVSGRKFFECKLTPLRLLTLLIISYITVHHDSRILGLSSPTERFIEQAPPGGLFRYEYSLRHRPLPQVRQRTTLTEDERLSHSMVVGRNPTRASPTRSVPSGPTQKETQSQTGQVARLRSRHLGVRVVSRAVHTGGTPGPSLCPQLHPDIWDPSTTGRSVHSPNLPLRVPRVSQGPRDPLPRRTSSSGREVTPPLVPPLPRFISRDEKSGPEGLGRDEGPFRRPRRGSRG